MGRLTVEQLRAARTDANVAAFLRAIRSGESSQDDAAFHMLVYGGRFDNLSDHPRIHKDRTTHQIVPDWRHAPPNSTSSAAGAFQFTETTWDGLVKTYGFTNFLPETQELGAIALIAEHNAVDDVLAGRLDAACAKLATTWTSLPGGPESNAKARERVRQVYADWGGWYEPHVGDGRAPDAIAAPLLSAAPDAAPTKEKPVLPFLLPILAQLIPQVAKILIPDGGGEVAQRNQALANTVVDTVVKATSELTQQQHTPASAIEALSDDPALLDKVRAAVITHPEVIGMMEAGEGGIKAAREAASNPAGLPFWKNGAFYISGSAIALAGFVVVWVLTHDYSENIQTQVITAAIAFATSAYMFWLGSSRGSQQKDEVKV